MDFGEINASVNPQKINYSEAKFSRIIVREVYEDDVPSGTYHIKPIENISAKFLIEFLKKEMPGKNIGMIDKEDYLNLEYPIYLISYDSRVRLVQHIEQVDAKLDEFMNNRNKKGE